jgi:hypothetical protein
MEFKKIKYNYWIFQLPYINRFFGMTVAPNLYLKEDYIPGTLLDHEKVHLRQQGNRWKFIFYFFPLYLIKWGIGVTKYGFTMGAYFSIDWEREAYVLTTPGFLSRMGYPELDNNPFSST